VSPQSKGLWDRAIMQSNPVVLPVKSLETQMENGRTYLSFLGCDDDLSCLRGKSVEEIVDAQAKFNSDITVELRHIIEIFYPWVPTIDGQQVEGDPLFEFMAGNFNHMVRFHSIEILSSFFSLGYVVGGCF